MQESANAIPDSKLTVTCPSCGNTATVPCAFAGHSVRCKRCKCSFEIKPAPIVTETPVVACDSIMPAERSSSAPLRYSCDPTIFAAGRGHPEFPCLSRLYSPGGRVPCIDFSEWLGDRVIAGDADAIVDFKWRVVEANPGVGVGTDTFRRHWQESAKSVLRYPLERHLRSHAPEAFVELRVALLTVLIHESFGGFIMASDAPRYVATIMLPHELEVLDIESLIKRANVFIRMMRKDTPFWEDFPLFKADALLPWNIPRVATVLEFCQTLRKLPHGSRCHFMDAVSRADTRAASGAQALEQATSYATRKRGLDAEESANRIVNSGLSVRSNDPKGLLRRWTVKELHELLTAEELEFKKSWSKDRLISVAIEQCPSVVTESMRDKYISCLCPTFEPAVQWAHAEIEATIPFFQVWLGFAFEQDN